MAEALCSFGQFLCSFVDVWPRRQPVAMSIRPSRDKRDPPAPTGQRYWIYPSVVSSLQAANLQPADVTLIRTDITLDCSQKARRPRRYHQSMVCFQDTHIQRKNRKSMPGLVSRVCICRALCPGCVKSSIEFAKVQNFRRKTEKIALASPKGGFAP